MTSLERFNSVLKFEKPDRVPVCPFVMAFAAKFAGVPYSQYCTDHKQLVKAQIASVEHFGYDIVTPDTDPYREAEACGAEIEFVEDDLPLEKKAAIVNKQDFLKFRIPDFNSHRRLADKIYGVEKLREVTNGEMPVLGWVEAPFQSASILRGLNDFMLDIYEDTEFIMELMEFSYELSVKYALAQVDAGAHIIGIGDAVATMVSKNTYEEYAFPYTRKLIAEIKNTGAKVKYHICGDSTHLLPLIKDLNADLVNIDTKVDLVKAREVLGRTTAIKGNIDPVDVLLNGDEAKIIKASKDCLGAIPDGFMLSPGCEVPKNTPHKNMKAMVHSVR
jgi:MtaA/CmuA family methyltransferase